MITHNHNPPYSRKNGKQKGIAGVLEETIWKTGMRSCAIGSQVVAEEDGTDSLDNVVKKKRKHTDTSHGSDHPPPPPIDASKQIVEVPNKGETLDYIATFEMRLLEEYKNSPIGPFSMMDVLPFESKHRPEAPPLNLEGVMERFGAFKKYDTVSDHSDHFYSAFKLTVRQQKGLKDWSVNLTKEWKVVEEQLPDNIFVRAYEGTVNLLRAAIIGPHGTPYHDGLFFFDICFTSNYPRDSPLVHYCYDGLEINPNILLSGSLFKLLPKRDKGGKMLGLESIWVPDTSDMLSLLIFLKDLFNATPFLNGLHDHLNCSGGRHLMFYNEVAFIKSLKTMVAVMNNPLKHFEDFVVGHFRNHATHILDAFQAYTEGVRVGSIIDGVPADGNQGTFSPTFKDDLATSINPLLEAFKKIGAFVGAEYTTFEMHLLEKYKNSPIGPFSILDVLPFESKHRPEAPSLNLEGVMERFGAFKKYDTVSDHSDHFYSAYKLSVRQQKGLEDWSDNLTKEWKAVEEQLPENIFVRAYEGTVNLLRAAIIGPQGTPYHDGLFFFDICFTSNYPKDSPLVHYCYDGLHINPNIRSSGSLFKLFPKRDKGGKLLGLESIWVPGTSDMLSLLIFLRSLFNATPLLNGVHDHVNFCGGRQVMFYNEVVFIKSLKTMVVVMNNPLKHFEDFVVGHFRNHATHILDAFQAYTEGVRVGSIIDGVPADVFMIPNPNIDLSGLALFATKLLIHLWLWAFRNYMKKRYEELSHRLARIEATLKDIKQGINQLVASSQFRTNANGYVDNKNKSIVAEEGMTDSLDDVVKKKGKHTGTSHGPHHPPPPIIASNQMVEVPTKGETMVHIKKSGFVVKNGFEIKTLY
ncbi:hypothetical protein R6Q59_002187 [Mikania micrantha]